MGLAPETQRFLSAPIRYVDAGSATVAYRQFGSVGEPLVLLHGWPFAGSTFRRLVPLLEQRFTCYVPDLPGAGDSPWTEASDFSFDGRARIVADFVGRLGLSRYSLVGHDTGGTVARLLARADASRVSKLAIINTEMPGHRPPWIPLYRMTMGLPGANLVFRQIIRSRSFVHSNLGFGSCFYDRNLLDTDFRGLVIEPIIASSVSMN